MEITACVTLADCIAATAGERLANARTASDICTVMAWLNESVERELAAQPDSGESLLACRPGCASCCIVNVSVLIPEAVAIAGSLQVEFSDVPSEIRDRIDDLSDRVRWLEDEERPRLHLPCAFLDRRGWCLVHPVRPLLCRSVSSTDSESCRKSLECGDGDVVMNLPQKILCNLVFMSLGSVLQSNGMDCRSIELMRMVRNLLERPELVDDFISGRRLAFQ